MARRPCNLEVSWEVMIYYENLNRRPQTQEERTGNGDG